MNKSRRTVYFILFPLLALLVVGAVVFVVDGDLLKGYLRFFGNVSRPTVQKPITVDTFAVPKVTIALKSDFFKNDPTVKSIVDENKALDVSQLSITQLNSVSGSAELDRFSFAYKLQQAFLMLHYPAPVIPKVQNWVAYESKYHVVQLNRFQKQMGIAQSNLLDSFTVTLLDQKLYEKEQEYKKLAQSFPLLSKMAVLHPNSVSKEYVAGLMVTAFNALPESYRLKTESDYIDCLAITTQCSFGQLMDSSGESLQYVKGDFPSSFYFEHYKFPVALDKNIYSNVSQSSASSVLALQPTFHELAHYLDSIAHKPVKGTPSMKGIIDTRGFYEIGTDIKFDYSTPKEKPYATFKHYYDGKEYYLYFSGGGCFFPKEGLDFSKDFVTVYAAGLNKNWGNFDPKCVGKVIPVEDFAESFTVYVMAGKDFRSATQKSTILKEKYDWLKTNVFGGVEYDTDLPADLNCGADPNGPKYFKCDDPNYIWDGQLRTL
jgi:hypothetical protein